MKTYIEYISLLSANKVDKDFANSNTEKAKEVLVKIFEQSKEFIRIFAGSLCNNDVSNSPKYILALSDFIERGGKVEIAINSYNEENIRQSDLFKRLSYYIAEGKHVQIYKTDVKPHLTNDPEKKEVHFTIGDDIAYRLETDVDNRTAVCNFNSPERAKSLIEFFDEIKKSAQPVNLQDIFAE